MHSRWPTTLSNISQHTPRNTQGLPLGSGLGSSAASAAAAAWAVNSLFGSAAVGKQELIVAGLAAEAAVSGYHADNVGPSLMGGFILIRCALFCRFIESMWHSSAEHSSVLFNESSGKIDRSFLTHRSCARRRSCTPGQPLQLLQLPYGGKDNLFFVLVNPVFEAPTKAVRWI